MNTNMDQKICLSYLTESSKIFSRQVGPIIPHFTEEDT